MSEEKIMPLEIFKKGIEDSKKYYHHDFDEISNEEIEKAINILMNEREINNYLRIVKRNEDARINKFHSNHCKICNKAYASFGISTVNQYNEKDTVWFCLEHEAFGQLKKIEKELEEKQKKDKNLEDVYRILKQLASSLVNKFWREYDKEYEV